MSEPGSPSRWSSHPALRVFGIVFLARDVILTAVALVGLAAGGLASEATLVIVALGLAAVALAGVVVSSIVGQRRAHASMALPAAAGLPASRNPFRAALRERPPAQDAYGGAVAGQVSSGRELEAEMSRAHDQGAWDDENWAYRKRVEAWTQRTVEVLEGSGRDDLARALAELEPPQPPPFQALLAGHSPTFARLKALLDGRIKLLEESQAA
jgi:hypothetical protein